MISIRPLAFADLNRLLEMNQALSAFHGDVAGLTFETLSRDAMSSHPWIRIFVAEAKDVLVGYVGLVPKLRFHDGERLIDVHHLFVEEHWRGKGVGQKLLTHSAEVATSLDCIGLTISTAPDNVHAQEVYQAYGFVAVEGQYPQFKLSLA